MLAFRAWNFGKRSPKSLLDSNLSTLFRYVPTVRDLCLRRSPQIMAGSSLAPVRGTLQLNETVPTIETLGRWFATQPKQQVCSNRLDNNDAAELDY